MKIQRQKRQKLKQVQTELVEINLSFVAAAGFDFVTYANNKSR